MYGVETANSCAPLFSFLGFQKSKDLEIYPSIGLIVTLAINHILKGANMQFLVYERQLEHVVEA